MEPTIRLLHLLCPSDPAPGLGEEEVKKEAKEEEEENHWTGTLAEDHFSDPEGSASSWELSQHKRVPLMWGVLLLLGLVLVAVVLLVVMAKKKGNRLGVGGPFQSSRTSDMAQDPSSEAHQAGDSGMAEIVPYVRLDSPPSFDNTTYTNLALEPPPGKAPAPPPPSPPPLPPKVVMSPKPVTYATVILLGGDKGELTEGSPSSASPPS